MFYLIFRINNKINYYFNNFIPLYSIPDNFFQDKHKKTINIYIFIIIIINFLI